MGAYRTKTASAAHHDASNTTHSKQPILEHGPPQLELLEHLWDLASILRERLGVLDQRRNGLRIGGDKRLVAGNAVGFGSGGGGGRHDG